jgi:hypothetical protein
MSTPTTPATSTLRSTFFINASTSVGYATPPRYATPSLLRRFGTGCARTPNLHSQIGILDAIQLYNYSTKIFPKINSTKTPLTQPAPSTVTYDPFIFIKQPFIQISLTQKLLRFAHSNHSTPKYIYHYITTSLYITPYN